MTYTSLVEFAASTNRQLVLWLGRAPDRRIRERLWREGYVVWATVWPADVLEGEGEATEVRTDLIIKAVQANGLHHLVDGFGLTDEQQAAISQSRILILS